MPQDSSVSPERPPLPTAPPPPPNTEHRPPNTAPPPPSAVAALAAAVGLFAQTAQIVMFREMLATCRGTEVFFGVVLAAGLLWTALGSLLAGLFARRASRRRGAAWPQRAWSAAAALFALNGLLLIGQVALARHRTAAGAGGAAELTFLEAVATAALATAPVALACGAQFVLALHAAPPRAFGRLYQADAWGAVAGGLLFTFLLVGLLDPLTLGPVLTAALCLAVHLAGGRRWMATGFVVGLVAAVAAWGYGLDGRLQARRWRALQPGYRLVATRDSRFGHLAVLRHPGERQHTLYHDGGLVETVPPPGAPSADARGLALFALAQHPAPRRVLLVGRAVGRLPRALLEAGAQQLDALELDPALFDLARQCTGAQPHDPRLRRHFADGRYFLKQRRGPDAARYDVILLELPTPLSAFVNRYYTAEFFREARAALGPDGVLVTSVMAAANYPGETVSRLSASIVRTLGTAFAEVPVVPGERHLFVAAARPGVASLDPQRLGERMAARGVWFDDFDPAFRSAAADYYAALFSNLIPTSQVADLRRQLASAPAPLNTDARPITYQCALLVWNQIVSASTQARDPGLRGGTNALFRAALRFRFAHGLVLPAALLLPTLVLVAAGRWRRRPGGPGRAAAGYGILATAFATGLFGMAAEIVLLFAFQSAYGYAYAQVGTIVAAFMVGLAVGARVGARWQRRVGFLAVVVAAMAVYCGGLPLVLRALAGGGGSTALYPVFLSLVLAAGFLDGATFPALVAAMQGLGVERPGAWVYSADLAGASLGALATGALLIPVLGNAAALGLVAAALAAALACLLPAFSRLPVRSA